MTVLDLMKFLIHCCPDTKVRVDVVTVPRGASLDTYIVYDENEDTVCIRKTQYPRN